MKKNTHKLLIVGSTGEISKYLQTKCTQHKLSFDVVQYERASTWTLADWTKVWQENAYTDIVLCLKAEAVPAMVANIPAEVRVFDTSPTYRLDPDWHYFHALLSSHLPEKANRIAVPGCFATGALSLLAPLGVRGVLPPQIVLDSTGGYCTIPASTRPEQINIGMYALRREHPHAAEIKRYARIDDKVPFVFHPKVGNFKRGILTSLYLPDLSAEYAMEIYQSWYRYMPHVTVEQEAISRLYMVREEIAKLHVIPESQGCTVLSMVDNFYHGCVIHILKACNVENLGSPV